VYALLTPERPAASKKQMVGWRDLGWKTAGSLELGVVRRLCLRLPCSESELVRCGECAQCERSGVPSYSREFSRQAYDTARLKNCPESRTGLQSRLTNSQACPQSLQNLTTAVSGQCGKARGTDPAHLHRSVGSVRGAKRRACQELPLPLRCWPRSKASRDGLRAR
jgi:hypothetical protein